MYQVVRFVFYCGVYRSCLDCSDRGGIPSENLTETMVAIEGESMRGVTWVVIDEVKSGDWDIGGQALNTEAVLQMQKGAGSNTAAPTR